MDESTLAQWGRANNMPHSNNLLLSLAVLSASASQRLSLIELAPACLASTQASSMRLPATLKRVHTTTINEMKEMPTPNKNDLYMT